MQNDRSHIAGGLADAGRGGYVEGRKGRGGVRDAAADETAAGARWQAGASAGWRRWNRRSTRAIRHYILSDPLTCATPICSVVRLQQQQKQLSAGDASAVRPQPLRIRDDDKGEQPLTWP